MVLSTVPQNLDDAVIRAVDLRSGRGEGDEAGEENLEATGKIYVKRALRKTRDDLEKSE